MMTRTLSAACFAFLLAAPAPAAPASGSAAPAAARDLLAWQEVHDRAAAGDKQAAIDLVARLESRLAEEPANQLARVYLGSALTLRSRDLPIGPGKLETLKRGGAAMDQAVAAAPGDLRVRLIRAVNSSQLPALFGRRPVALADFDLLVAALDRGTGDLTPEERQAAYYYAGVTWKKSGQKERGRAALEKALAAAPDLPLANKIRKELAR